ncbi:unnamed protein product [Acanthoscelides obtectus]|uniref:Uncharacterized protein n=1 Tax=Acanthoscelides obtectus TaxID=200917 RepID=A0A9P0KYD8_ACAOB|nr:unnamed protein product [Acanthoscelides obtectus]CAK1663019.1 hypothetical protein AOBTE_LOCUS23434 [Acanthoscelides obtectus]
MIAQVVFVASLMAFANAGHLLGHHSWGLGFGGGFGGGLGGLGGVGGIGGGVGDNGGGVGDGVGHGHVVDYYAPPHYEYRYAVHDPHTHDVKEQAEVRVGDETHSSLAWGEHDRHAEVHRLIHHSVPVVIAHHHGHGWGK